MRPCDNWQCDEWTKENQGECPQRENCTAYSFKEYIEISHVEYDDEQMGREK